MKKLFSLLVCFMAVSYASAGTITYTYDTASRLNEADYGSGNVINYTYDSAGNLLKRQTTVAGTVTAVPDIKANNANGSIKIKTSDTLSITVDLYPGTLSGNNADWWLAALLPNNTYYYYSATQNTWIPGFNVSYQAVLANLSTAEVLKISSLPVGTYTFYFGVDTDINGAFDTGSDQFYVDSVVVNVQ